MPSIYRMYTIRLARDVAKENNIIGEALKMPKKGEIFRLYNKRPKEELENTPAGYKEYLEKSIPKKSFRVKEFTVFSHWEYKVVTDLGDTFFLDVLQVERIRDNVYSTVKNQQGTQTKILKHETGRRKNNPQSNDDRTHRKQSEKVVESDE